MFPSKIHILYERSFTFFVINTDFITFSELLQNFLIRNKVSTFSSLKNALEASLLLLKGECTKYLTFIYVVTYRL